MFFDPQYEKKPCELKWPTAYQTNEQITLFILEIERILAPNGYLALWISKNVLLECRVQHWLTATNTLKVLDMLIWKKNTVGFGSRFRNQAEFLLLVQKKPWQANFTDRSFSNVWSEGIKDKQHPHQKPIELLKKLILALTKPEDLIIDPCAGSFIVLKACQATNRQFLGCDLTITPIKNYAKKRNPRNI